MPPLACILRREHKTRDDVDQKCHREGRKSKFAAVFFIGHPVSPVVEILLCVGKKCEQHRDNTYYDVQGQNDHVPEEGGAHVGGNDHVQSMKGLPEVLKNSDACRDYRSKRSDDRDLDKGFKHFNVPKISHGEHKDPACSHGDEELKAAHVQSPCKAVAKVRYMHTLNQLINPRRKSCSAHCCANYKGSRFFSG